MTCIDKIILAFVIVQVAVVLAKPYEPENDDGLNQFSDDMDNFVYKREESCSVEPQDRINCGYGGITKQQCESKGCCFDDSIGSAFWCFKTVTTPPESCSVAPVNRNNCGWGGITKQQCEGKGCCWDSSVRGAPWCFEPADCGSGCNWNGCFYQRCRSSCRSEESHSEKYDNKCSGADKCCLSDAGKHGAWPQMG
ncbi:uncharacterized protein LOC144662374 [Oculina patagonica]